MNPTEFQADDVIRNLVSRLERDPDLNICVVSHKSLYNDGCIRFFGWLSTGILGGVSQRASDHSSTTMRSRQTREGAGNSKGPFPRSLDSLQLSDVHMGDEGFQAFVSWLSTLHEPRFPLTKLSIRANEIRGDAESASQFVLASPRLASLILSNNPLSPEFKRTLLSLLPELPHLAFLHLSMTGLNLTDARALATYISGGCKLVELHASSNNLGYKGVRAIVRAMRHYWTMEKLEVYGNDNGDGVDDLDDLESEDEWNGWQPLQTSIMNLLARNVFLKRQTAREALTLLKYSRLMLRPLPPPETTSSCAECECIPPTTRNAGLSPLRSQFHALPIEIQLSILSQLTPTLSTQQRLKIFAYATDLRTLPSLRLRLPTSKSSGTQCLPDPSNPVFPNQIMNGAGKKMGSLRRDTAVNIHTCGDGSCMGNESVLCKRKTDRQKWLEQTGCDSYDLGLRE